MSFVLWSLYLGEQRNMKIKKINWILKFMNMWLIDVIWYKSIKECMLVNAFLITNYNLIYTVKI